MPLLKINGNTLDPEAPTARALGLQCDDASSSNYILLQMKQGTFTKQMQQELEKLGVLIHEKVSQDSYLCGYKQSVGP